MNKEKYKMSFTTGGLFLNESLKAAGIYLRIGGWNEARAEIINKNILQSNRVNHIIVTID